MRSSAAGRGKIVIHFANADEFERLRDHFTDRPARSAGGLELEAEQSQAGVPARGFFGVRLVGRGQAGLFLVAGVQRSSGNGAAALCPPRACSPLLRRRESFRPNGLAANRP